MPRSLIRLEPERSAFTAAFGSDDLGTSTLHRADFGLSPPAICGLLQPSAA